MVFPTFFNLSLNFTKRSWRYEPQSTPGLVLLTATIFDYKEYNQSDFNVGIWWCPCVSHILCWWKGMFARTRVSSWWNSLSLCPVSFYMPRPNLIVTPGVSWLLLWHFNPLWWKRYLCWGVSSRTSYRSSQNWSTWTSSALVVGA